jgi:hypothetical protein
VQLTQRPAAGFRLRVSRRLPVGCVRTHRWASGAEVPKDVLAATLPDDHQGR